MKRFVLAASMLVFAFVTPAGADPASPNQHARRDGCPWFCRLQPLAAAAQPQEAATLEAPAPGAVSDAAPGEAPVQQATAPSTKVPAGAAAEAANEAQPLLEAGEAAPADAATHAKKPKKRKREKAAQEEPNPGGMWVGANGGGWGPSEPPEMAPMVKYVRLESGSTKEFESFQAAGIHVDWDDWGPYAHGVSSIDDAEYAAHVVGVIEADPSIVSVEILNEPEGNWFWGEGATSKANAEAYARLLEAVYSKVEARFGSEHPLLLGAFEEGASWGDLWWNALKQKDAVDGVVVHPYGGSANRAQSALGNRGEVERAHSYTGKQVYVTEVGWPTATKFPPTSDSLQWTQPEQAANIYSFVNWARATGYVAGVFIYGYRDAEADGPAQYGVLTHSGVKKNGWTALRQSSEGVACTVCS